MSKKILFLLSFILLVFVSAGTGFAALPGQATSPRPSDASNYASLISTLSWTAGAGAETHDIYMGTDPGSLVLEEAGLTSTSYDPGLLDSDTTYYWRVDEVNGEGTTTGNVWSFTTDEKAHTPSPSDLETEVDPNSIISWTAGIRRNSQDLYFGTDFNDVNNSLRPLGDIDVDCGVDEADLAMIADQWLTNPGTARLSSDLNTDKIVNLVDYAIFANSWRDTTDSIFQGNQAVNATSFHPHGLRGNTTYYWRVDGVRGAVRYRGDMWSFTTFDTGFPAFPGAEGWGFNTPGGRGGQVIKVTNLNSSGAGSLNAACQISGPRIVVFEVSGVINGDVVISKPYITIAGQTAPGGGITIEGRVRSYGYAIHDAVIRHLRVRPKRPPGSSSGGDGFQIGGVGTYNVMIDHCSVCWGNDECIDLYNGQYMTVQWCTIEESDPEGHSYGTPHNYGMISAGSPACAVCAHHNLWAHHQNRVPCMGPYGSDGHDDFRNNVIYDCQMGQTWEGHVGGTAIVNNHFNYWRRGPQTFDSIYPFRTVDYAEYYANSNYYEGWGIQGSPMYWTEATTPEWVRYNHWGIDVPHPGYVPYINTDPVTDANSAEALYDLILAKAGGWPRDRVTLRTIDEVINQTGLWERCAPLEPTDEWFMEGLTPTAPPVDTDNDGMPDDWETAHGLNSGDPGDATDIVPAGASPDDRHMDYTYIEYYINELADNLVP